MATNGNGLSVLALILTAVLAQEPNPVLRSCSELKAAGYSNDGEYRIDPDGPGIGLPSHVVYCDMENSRTIVDHDRMIHAVVPRGFEDAGEFRVPVTYQAGVPLQQLTKLADISAYCSQYISVDCNHVHLWESGEPSGYWVSRYGEAMPNWGTPTGTKGCECSLDNSCADEQNKHCNCDANDGEWRQDDGELTDKSTLPVTELRFGDTGSEREKLVFKVGPLKCEGMEQDTFSSCDAWAAAGYTGEGDYLIRPPGRSAQVKRCHEQFLLNPPPVLRSCEELRKAGYTANDEYWIDPDTTLVGLEPFPVFCDMTSGTTIVRNDRQGPLMSKGFNEKGEHRVVIHYNGASIKQVSSLIDLSDTCQQYMSMECHESSIWSSHGSRGEYTWWISRNGTHMSNWGTPTGTRGCACSLTQRCNRPTRKCNCDSNDDVWRQDDGYITDKATLPIWEVRIGDTGSSDEVALYNVGELKCKGIGTKLYASCDDLLDAGFSGEGHYLIDPDGNGAQAPHVVECNGTTEITSTVVFCPNVTRQLWQPVPITTGYKRAPLAPQIPKGLQEKDSSRPQGLRARSKHAADSEQRPRKSQGQLSGFQQAVCFIVVGVIILLIIAIAILIIAAIQWNKTKILLSTIYMTNSRYDTAKFKSNGKGKAIPDSPDSFSNLHFFQNSGSLKKKPTPEQMSFI